MDNNENKQEIKNPKKTLIHFIQNKENINMLDIIHEMERIGIAYQMNEEKIIQLLFECLLDYDNDIKSFLKSIEFY